MNKQYIRNGLEYYMKIELMGGEDYEYQMLAKNKIAHLLPMQLDQINQKQYLLYTATEYKPFWITSDKMWISGRQLHSIVDSLLNTIDEIKRYLLSADNLVLEPECLFLNLSGFQLYFLYVPGYGQDIVMQMAKLMEYLLGKIDYEDSEGVVFAYGIYRMLKEPTANLEEIRNYTKQFQAAKSRETDWDSQNSPKSQPVRQVLPTSQVLTISNETQSAQKILSEIKEEQENVRKTKVSWGLAISGILLILIIIGIGAMLYLIYGYGIEIWKRNVLLILAAGLLLNSIIFLIQWKKRKQKKEAQKIFESKAKPAIQPVAFQNITARSQDMEIRRNVENDFHQDFQETMVLNAVEKNPENKEEGKLCRLLEVGEGACREIRIHQTPFVLGNYDTGVDYCLKDRQISRFHAVIFRKDGAFYIKDLHSTNGTKLNEVRLELEEERKLQNNDWVQFADLRFRFLVG